MTLQQFMLAYKENWDNFIIYNEDGKEIQRFTMGKYFAEGFNDTYGYSRIISFTIDVVGDCFLYFHIYLDDLNQKTK